MYLIREDSENESMRAHNMWEILENDIRVIQLVCSQHEALTDTEMFVSQVSSWFNGQI